MANQKQVDWTPERVEELIELAKTKVASEIARQWRVTRNVICGKLARIGAKCNPKPRPVRPPRPPKVKLIRVKSRDKNPLAENLPATIGVDTFLVLAGMATMPRRGVDIMRLTGSTCRYPLWDDREPFHAKFYCGAATVDLLPYCKEHCQLCYGGHKNAVEAKWR